MRKLVVGSIVLVLLVSDALLTSGVGAAELDRPIRIGALNAGWGPTPGIVGLRDGLVELGYREEEDFVLGVRFTQGDLTALHAAARELVQYGVDLIFTTQEYPTRAAQRATSRIPIVFANVGNPVALGLVQSFAQPGSNLTGVSNLELELLPKRLELFRELVPGLQRVLFLYDPNHPYSVAAAKEYRAAARRIGIALIEQPVRTETEAQATLAQVHKGEVDGMMQPPSTSLNLPGLILEVTSQQAIPAMFNGAFWPKRGALVSYGPDYHKSGRQAARLVDKILKGANPGEIPVEVNPKIEFVINLRTAKALELTIPPEVLYQADRIIR